MSQYKIEFKNDPNRIFLALGLLILLLMLVNTLFAEPQSKYEITLFENVTFAGNKTARHLQFIVPNVHPLLRDTQVELRGVWVGHLDGVRPCESEMGRKAKEFTTKFFLTGENRLQYHGVVRGRLYADVWNSVRGNLAKELYRAHLGAEWDGGTAPQVDWCKLLQESDRFTNEALEELKKERGGKQ